MIIVSKKLGIPVGICLSPVLENRDRIFGLSLKGSKVILPGLVMEFIKKEVYIDNSMDARNATHTALTEIIKLKERGIDPSNFSINLNLEALKMLCDIIEGAYTDLHKIIHILSFDNSRFTYCQRYSKPLAVYNFLTQQFSAVGRPNNILDRNRICEKCFSEFSGRSNGR